MLATNQRKKGVATAKRLAANFQVQHNYFSRQSTIQDFSRKSIYLLAFKLAKANKLFSNAGVLYRGYEAPKQGVRNEASE